MNFKFLTNIGWTRAFEQTKEIKGEFVKMKHTFMKFKTIINHHKWSTHIHEFKLLHQKELNTHTQRTKTCE
jgi:hypothetical protein